MVIDECHHLAAAAYDHSVKRIGAQFWLGLTATPARRDGLGELVAWQLGPVRHTLAQPEPGMLLESSADVAGPRRVLHVHDTEFRYNDLDVSAPGSFAEVHRALVADPARNSQIVRDLRSHRRCSECLQVSARTGGRRRSWLYERLYDRLGTVSLGNALIGKATWRISLARAFCGYGLRPSDSRR